MMLIVTILDQGIGIEGNGAGLAWESQSHCFADKFDKSYTHSFGTDTQHAYSQGNCRIMSSIIFKLE